MELLSEISEQTLFNTKFKTEEFLLVVTDKSTHEENLSQPLQTNNKKFEKSVTFQSNYNDTFNVTIEKNKFYFTGSINDDESVEICISIGAYELESLNDEINPEANNRSKIRPNFLTLGNNIEISSNITGTQIASIPNNSMRYLLVFKPVTIHAEQNLSHYPVDVLTFDDIFLQTDIPQGMIFIRNRSRKNHFFAMDVITGCKK